jgi:TRAP-type C4-dicarboxylate transport system permease small subunit
MDDHPDNCGSPDGAFADSLCHKNQRGCHMSIGRLFQKLTGILQFVEMCIGSACLFVLFLLMISNTFMRYVIASPILWSDELNNYLFVWMGFLGAAFIMGNDGHIRVTAILNILPPLGKYIVNIISNVIFIGACAIFMAPLFRLLDAVSFSGIMRIPLKFVYFVLPLSFFFMAIHVINNMIQDSRRFFTNEDGTRE